MKHPHCAKTEHTRSDSAAFCADTAMHLKLASETILAHKKSAPNSSQWKCAPAQTTERNFFSAI